MASEEAYTGVMARRGSEAGPRSALAITSLRPSGRPGRSCALTWVGETCRGAK